MTNGAIDFLRSPRQPRVGWVLLTLGSMAIVGALWCDQHWFAYRTAIEHAEREALAAQMVRQVPPKPAEPSLAQRRWEQAQVELRRPWLPTLRAIESATVNPVFLLSMTIDPAKGLIKLDGEAPSFDHALAYVQVLDEGGALRPAQLISHEQSPDGAPGHPSVKFSAVTRWRMP
jgi:hypothetical protein